MVKWMGSGGTSEKASAGRQSASKDRQYVEALARGLEVLSCFEVGDRMLSNKEIASRTGLAKSTVSRLTYTLTRLGYLKYDEGFGCYRTGAGVLGLGYAALANMKVRDLARPLMQDLADYSNALVSIAVRDRLSMIYVENCRARNTGTLRVHVGMRLPLPSTSIGRAFLAAIPSDEQLFLCDQLKVRDPESWEKNEVALRAAFQNVETKGFCVSLGDWQKDTYAVSVPFVNPEDGDVLSFSVSGPAYALSAKHLEDDLGPRLVYLVRHLEAQLRTVA